MKSLPEPDITVREIVESCTAGLQDRALARRLLSVLPSLEAAEIAYGDLGADSRLFEVAAADNIDGVVLSAEMTKLYKGSLSRQGSRSRRFYDRLKMAAPNDICPLCSQRVVKTLDHYLAKSAHPAYALTPINLVPACSDCNKGKLDRQPVRADDQTFHPYFDDVDDATWLVAEICESRPPAALFSVRPPPEWDAVKADRLRVHFQTFGLGELYAAQAGAEMVSIRFALLEAADAGGVEGIRTLLAQQARTRSRAGRNSWVAALYVGLADSDWFCTEGYRSLA